MSWYAAHMIQYFKLKEGVQKTYLVWENVVLIQAATPDDALKEAKSIGNEEYGDTGDESLRINDQPAISVFGGVRKLIECQDTVIFDRGDSSLPPSHGTEVTYSFLEVDAEELDDLIKGEAVTVLYEQ